MELKEGTLLQNGKYRIERFISSGGFGCTYEARHLYSNRKVAIKEFFIRDFCNRDEKSSYVTVGTQSKKALVERLKEKFVDEANSIWNLNHKGIVRVSDVFGENGTAYYVMDYIEGSSLDKIIVVKGSLTEAEMLVYVRQLAYTLRYIHNENILHLDIKPSNIMIDNDGNALLIDFGASKQYVEVEVAGVKVNTTTLMGKTPGYAPLEQMDNEVAEFYPATDIYALGATMYKMLTGVTPPNAIKRATGVKMNPLPSSVSENIRKAILCSMELLKENRPQSIDEFLSIIDGKDQEIIVVEVEDTELQKQPQPEEKPYETFDVKGVTFKMIKVEGGTFKMGAQKDNPNGTNYDNDADDDESPVHSVTLSDYYIGETEVTQELWQAVMGNNPSYYKGFQKPVERVSWNDCQEFIKKLNQLTGKNFSLPTEAEWEYAARGGNKSKGYKYSGSNTKGDVAWYDGNSNSQTHDVKTKLPNELGIYDMSGNVWEWCQDWYKSDYYSNSPQTNPTGPSSGSSRVFRGGSWFSHAGSCRVSYRNFYNPDNRSSSSGFRLAAKFDEDALGNIEDQKKAQEQYARTHGSKNGHDWVDLGLSVKWATCNIGANKPEDYGDYFAWGETKTKDEYIGTNYEHIIIKRRIFESTRIEYAYIGNDISGNSQYDAARTNWGGTWRLPTKAELQELKNKCTWKWTTQNGVEGYKVTGPNGNSIFLPAAGYRYGSSLDRAGEYGYYWSSTPNESYGSGAYSLYFDGSDQRVNWGGRYYGRSVRPVAE